MSESNHDSIRDAKSLDCLAQESGFFLSQDTSGELILRSLYSMNKFLYYTADEAARRLWRESDRNIQQRATPEEIRLVLGRDYL
jgi:hypothetical protein